MAEQGEGRGAAESERGGGEVEGAIPGATPGAADGLAPGAVHVALYEPEIPGNAGNVARLCAATGSPLHLIGRLGFSFQHPKAKRAVMDYWESLELHRHVNYDDFAAATAGARVWMLTTRASRSFWDVSFAPGDVLLLGPESRGLPDSLLAAAPELAIRIPIASSTRSLNLGTATAVVLYEALRQLRE